jgi:hypothetical protein
VIDEHHFDDEPHENTKAWKNGFWSIGAVKQLTNNCLKEETDRLVMLGLIGTEKYEMLFGGSSEGSSVY